MNSYKYGIKGGGKPVIRKLVEKLYYQQNELDEDLIEGGTFSHNDLALFFDIAQELTLPIGFNR